MLAAVWRRTPKTKVTTHSPSRDIAAQYPAGQWIREKTRSKHLLTGLLRCGCCGGGFASVGKDYLACSAARKQGACTQNRSFKRGDLEEVVLTLLRERLMRPEAVAAFITSVSREMNAGRAEESAARARLETERAQVTRRLDGLCEAIADGLRTAGLKTKLEEMEGGWPRLTPSLRLLRRRRCGCTRN